MVIAAENPRAAIASVSARLMERSTSSRSTAAVAVVVLAMAALVVAPKTEIKLSAK